MVSNSSITVVDERRNRINRNNYFRYFCNEYLLTLVREILLLKVLVKTLPDCLMAKMRGLRFCSREIFTELYLFICCLSFYRIGQNNLKWLISVTQDKQLVCLEYDSLKTLSKILQVYFGLHLI